jgi:hypothetical protein
MTLRYFLKDFEMVAVAPVITGFLLLLAYYYYYYYYYYGSVYFVIGH